MFQTLPSVHFPAQTFRAGRISLALFGEERNSAQEAEMIHLSHTAGCMWLSRFLMELFLVLLLLRFNKLIWHTYCNPALYQFQRQQY